MHVLFGQTVDKMGTGDGLGKMYNTFLSHTTITSKKKAHLAHQSFSTVLEDMGYVAFD